MTQGLLVSTKAQVSTNESKYLNLKKICASYTNTDFDLSGKIDLTVHAVF